MTIQETQDLQDGLDPAASLASIAYERIKMKLIMLDIRPGSPINDGALAAELGVGRTPVREALKRLETDHLVVSYSRRGTFAEKIRSLEIADGDRNNFLREDMSVHRLIYRASGNAHLENVLIRYDNLATRIWCLVIDKVPDLVEHIRDHAQLLEAIADGDGDSAAQLALDHVTGFDQAIRRFL